MFVPNDSGYSTIALGPKLTSISFGIIKSDKNNHLRLINQYFCLRFLATHSIVKRSEFASISTFLNTYIRRESCYSF